MTGSSSGESGANSISWIMVGADGLGSRINRGRKTRWPGTDDDHVINLVRVDRLDVQRASSTSLGRSRTIDSARVRTSSGSRWLLGLPGVWKAGSWHRPA